MYAYEIDPRRRLVYCRTWGMITVIDIINVRDAVLCDRRAIVATEPAHFNVARLIRIHREMSGVISDLLVCRSLQEALDSVDASSFIPGMLTQVG